jgi:hypothetical protein
MRTTQVDKWEEDPMAGGRRLPEPRKAPDRLDFLIRSGHLIGLGDSESPNRRRGVCVLLLIIGPFKLAAAMIHFVFCLYTSITLGAWGER